MGAAGTADLAFVLFMFGALLAGVTVHAIVEAIAPYFRPWRRRERQRRRRERRPGRGLRR